MLCVLVLPFGFHNIAATLNKHSLAIWKHTMNQNNFLHSMFVTTLTDLARSKKASLHWTPGSATAFENNILNMCTALLLIPMSPRAKLLVLPQQLGLQNVCLWHSGYVWWTSHGPHIFPQADVETHGCILTGTLLKVNATHRPDQLHPCFHDLERVFDLFCYNMRTLRGNASCNQLIIQKECSGTLQLCHNDSAWGYVGHPVYSSLHRCSTSNVISHRIVLHA